VYYRTRYKISSTKPIFFPFLPPAHLEKPNQETVSLAPPTSTKPKTATTNPKPKEKKTNPTNLSVKKKTVGWGDS
jgi:hypothetical protein